MENEIITAPAAQVVQGDLKLFTTSLKVRTLMQPGFYSIERLNPKKPDGFDSQRLYEKARAKKLANYILDGQEKQDAFLPASVFLATDKAITHDKDTNTISFRLKDVGPFSVVDGQHRLEGLREAAKLATEKSEKHPNALDRILDFEVPVNIAVKLPKIYQMCQFLIVNTTQKKVDIGIAQRIYARLTQSLMLKDMPTLPDWIRKIVDKGEVNKALKIVEYLNETEKSPWKDKIRMAGDPNPKGKTINQKSFVNKVEKHFLKDENPLATLNDFEKQKDAFLNYWKAIKEILDNGAPSVIYKAVGMELFCMFSIPFFSKLQGSFTVKTMRDRLLKCFENMEEEYAGIDHPEWWQQGSGSAGLKLSSTAAITETCKQMIQSLNRSEMGDDIEL